MTTGRFSPISLFRILSIYSSQPINRPLCRNVYHIHISSTLPNINRQNAYVNQFWLWNELWQRILKFSLRSSGIISRWFLEDRSIFWNISHLKVANRDFRNPLLSQAKSSFFIRLLYFRLHLLMDRKSQSSFSFEDQSACRLSSVN